MLSWCISNRNIGTFFFFFFFINVLPNFLLRISKIPRSFSRGKGISLCWPEAVLASDLHFYIWWNSPTIKIFLRLI